MPQNSILFWLVFVAWKAKWLVVAAVSKHSSSVGWFQKKYLGRSCQTLGFVWKAWVSQLTLRISRVLLVRGYGSIAINNVINAGHVDGFRIF
jgi:hypothetical protein